MGAAQGNKTEFTPGALPGQFLFTLVDEAGTERKYSTTRLGVSKARMILPYVASIAGSMVAVANGPDAALFSLSGSLEAADFAKFDTVLVSTTVRDGEKLSNAAALDSISVTGGMGEYMKLMIALMELNFAGVFTAGIERLAGARFLDFLSANQSGEAEPQNG